MMKKEYDFLIVGAGLFGLVSARLLSDLGYKCFLIDKRNHLGGNCYVENIDGINVHKYGPHIFHTNEKNVWDFVNLYTTVNHFSCRPKLRHGDVLYSFPINLMTMHQIWGVKTPEEAKVKIYEETKKYKEMYPNPKSSYEYAMQLVGPTLYNIFYDEYLKKQWNTDPKNIPANIIQRQTFRLTFDDNYYYDMYQGIPNYTLLFNRLIHNVNHKLSTDYLENKTFFNNIADNIIYTGQIDKYFNYVFGPLGYRSLRFEEEYLKIKDFQGTFMVSYPEKKYDFTRIIEHKHFEFGNQAHTIITKEYPLDWTINEEPYYPLNDKKYMQYVELSKNEKNVFFGGRMGTYEYINMDTTIQNAITLINKITHNHDSVSSFSL